MRTGDRVRQRAVGYLRAVVIAGVMAVAPRLGAQGPVSVMAPDQVTVDYLRAQTPSFDLPDTVGGFGVIGHRLNNGTLGTESLPTFGGYYYRSGADTDGNTQLTWPYTLVGRAPRKSGEHERERIDDREHAGKDRDLDRTNGWRRNWNEAERDTTWIDAPIIPVNLDLRNADGTPRFVNGVRLFSDATKYVEPTLRSPVFTPAVFDTSGHPTQYTDAIHRAQFYGTSGEHWHTMLNPSVKRTRTIVLTQGEYLFALNADGSCCAFVLVERNAFHWKLMRPSPFNFDPSPVMVQAENDGEITTQDLATFLLPNTFLYDTNGSCCVLGFHGYDLVQGDASNGFKDRRFVMNYSSWISPGLFQGFTDITALSHEMAETFSNPFVSNTSTWWIDTFTPYRMCQNNLEVADPLETLADPTYPMLVDGFTYHPQNVMLLQWFAGERPSTAYHGAYSFPDVNLVRIPSYSLWKQCLIPVDGYPYTPLPN